VTIIVMTIHVIADSDTRWKWGAALAARLANADAAVCGHLLHGRATPTERQLQDVSADVAALRRVGVAELLTDLSYVEADVVVLACVGGTIQALMHGLSREWSGRELRPIVVTGYVGVVYERMVDGLLLRAGADIVLANSAADARRFRDVYDAVGADPESVVTTALPFLGGAPWDAGAAGRDRPFTVCFVAQPSVPARRSERTYALEQAAVHANLHPDRHVLIKLRGRPGEQTTHIERHHYSTLLPGVAVPPNLDLVYGSMADVLDRTDLCVTVSSTAALEAMHRGIPTAVLTDFGVRETLGNHAFLHSGALTPWRALHDGAIPKVDPEWKIDNGVDDAHPDDAVRQRLAELLHARGELAPLRPWLRPEDAAGYLPALLARNGLDVDGSPLVTDFAWTRPDPGVGRRAMRLLARRAYRVGLRTIEPRIRKWAQL
jgi:hypothetical protein